VNIFLTFDYELFFGANTGTVQKCMLEPTERLLKMAGNEIKLIFFVDVGFLVRLEELKGEFSILDKDLQQVRSQIRTMVEEGHDVQLHVHPHWEKSTFDGEKWVIKADNAYRLDDFRDEEIRSILIRYKAYLDELVGYKTTAFRAGGWCVQPFNRLQSVFKELDLRIDSSVIPGKKYLSPHYKFDFTRVKQQDAYRFETDVCVEVQDGSFCEYPISSTTYSPLFYWKLYVLGRLFPFEHKMLGDGSFIAQPGKKKKGLTRWTTHHVSCDGFYASLLELTLQEFEAEGRKDMVIIGHPKGMTNYSLCKLEAFTKALIGKHQIRTFRELL
jgi:hypothetical protein